MPKARRIARTTALTQDLTDFSGGIRGGISDVRAPVRHVRLADNAIFDKRLGAITARLGYRDVLAGVLPAAGHSLMAFYGVSTNRYFVGDGTAIHEIVDGGAYTAQSLPVTPSTSRWSVANLNGALIATQEGGANLPIAFNGTDWLSTQFPTPTAPSQAIAAGGAVDAGTHLYRIRWRFKNGSSVAGATVSAAPSAGNLTVNLSAIPLSARSDYLGWTLERTKLTDTTLFYFVADGTATTYSDTVSDAALSLLIGAEPGVHAAPPHLEGLVAFRNRLIGWDATTLYVSQEVADAAEASGIYNFNALSNYPVEKDDGDAMKLCLVGGDRVVIFKRSSIHVLEGTDPTNYVRRRLPGNVGCASTRGAALVGTTIYFYGGDQQFYRLDGDKVTAIGQLEMRHYFELMDVTRDADVVCWDHERGRYFCAACRFTPETQNNHVLAYRTDYRHWTHWKDLRINDVLIPKKIGAFSSAKLLFADPLLGPPSSTSLAAGNPEFGLFEPNSSQIKAQKFDTSGSALWTAGGISVGSPSGGATNKGGKFVSDGAGGIIVVFIEDQDADADGRIVVQRLDASGTKLWGAAGISVSINLTSTKKEVAIVSDGAGGAIIAWMEKRGATTFNRLYAQRVNSSGATQWSPGDGVLVDGDGTTKALLNLSALKVSGGAILTYYNGSTGAVQRVKNDGTFPWGATPTITGNMQAITGPAICSDGADGAFVAWVDAGTTFTFVRRFLAADGSNPFAGAGQANFSGSTAVRICSDLAGGAILLWRSPTNLVARRVDAGGGYPWSAVLLDTTATNFQICSDEAGGAVVVWTLGPTTAVEGRAQRLSSSGASSWGANKIFRAIGVVGAAASDMSSLRLVSDGTGGAIAAWSDDRGTANTAFIQRFTPSGAEAWLANGLTTGIASSVSTGIYDLLLGDVAVAVTAGYHVWAGLEGFKDTVGVDGSGGTKRAFRIETPDSDDMQEDVEKDYDRATLFVKSGVASLNIGLVVDEGAVSVAVNLPVFSTGKRWGAAASPPTANTLYWNQGNWGGNRAREFVAPFPAGTIGKKARLTISADLDDDLVLSGATIDYEALPDRGY